MEASVEASVQAPGFFSIETSVFSVEDLPETSTEFLVGASFASMEACMKAFMEAFTA